MMHDTDPAESRREAARLRSEAWRDRKRRGCICVTVEVAREVVTAFERIGLLPVGEREPAAIADATATFLCAAPGVAAIGHGLFPATNGEADAG